MEITDLFRDKDGFMAAIAEARGFADAAAMIEYDLGISLDDVLSDVDLARVVAYFRKWRDEYEAKSS